MNLLADVPSYGAGKNGRPAKVTPNVRAKLEAKKETKTLTPPEPIMQQPDEPRADPSFIE